MSEILSLDQKRAGKIRKGSDLITVQQAYDMVIAECAKVHEFYLEQMPPKMARMIQDALLHYGIIEAAPTVLVEDAPQVNPSDVAEPTNDATGGV